jgi:hypothetical protein
MALVNAGVDHRDRDAVAGVAGRPRVRRADLRNTVVEQGLSLAVEPDPTDTAGGRERAPSLPLGRVERVPADARQRCSFTGNPCRARAGDDERHGVAPVVPELGQRGDVEDPSVDLTGSDRLERVRGDDVQMTAGLLDREPHAVPPGPGPNLTRLPTVEDDLVAGDERDGAVVLIGCQWSSVHDGSGGEHHSDCEHAKANSAHLPPPMAWVGRPRISYPQRPAVYATYPSSVRVTIDRTVYGLYATVDFW